MSWRSKEDRNIKRLRKAVLKFTKIKLNDTPAFFILKTYNRKKELQEIYLLWCWLFQPLQVRSLENLCPEITQVKLWTSSPLWPRSGTYFSNKPVKDWRNALNALYNSRCEIIQVSTPIRRAFLSNYFSEEFSSFFGFRACAPRDLIRSIKKTPTAAPFYELYQEIALIRSQQTNKLRYLTYREYKDAKR